MYAGWNTSVAISKDGDLFAWGDTWDLFSINEVIDLPIPVDLPDVFSGWKESVISSL